MTGESLSEYLVRTGVAGAINTPVHDVYRKAKMLVAGDPDQTMGLDHLLPTSISEIVRILSKLAGAELPPDESSHEPTRTDPDVVAAQIMAAGERLREACRRGQRVMFGTGHPAGPLSMYVRLAAALDRAGAHVLQFAEGESFTVPGWRGRAAVRYIEGVACVYHGGGLAHSHNFEPMEYLLNTGPLPDLVVGDHGFAGVALARGADAVALVDSNDPALLLAWGRAMPIWPILCDDNRFPDVYVPIAQLLADAITTG